MNRMHRATMLALAAAIDARLGDPPTFAHPVALIGRAAAALERGAPAATIARRRYGLAVAAALPLAAAATAQAALAITRRGGPPPARWAAEAVLLSLAGSLRTLCARATEVQSALEAGDLQRARALLAYHLVSRDTSTLDASAVAAATIESVAENLSDGVVAPALAYALGGLPAAWAYRAANTLDALWGYRSERYRALGYGAARIDDLLNLAPARLTALAICLAAAAGDGGGARAWRAWRRDAANTESPNAGHPMAAMAGALGVELAKQHAYTLGAGMRPPAAHDIGRAVRVARRAALVVAGGMIGGLVASELSR